MHRSRATGRLIGLPDDRSPEQIREHYDLERRLAARLRESTRDARRSLYEASYSELYSTLSHHPMVNLSTSAAARDEHARSSLRTLRPYLERASVMVEIGPGDCGVAIGAASHLIRVFAVDVADESAVLRDEWPTNLEYLKFDGLHVPLPDGVCDLAFSNQVIEHLHPDDAVEQIKEIRRLLAPGGTFVCVVPNRTTGPHDISQHFDDEASGFHLNEVTMRGMVGVLKDAGFRKIRGVVRVSDLVAEYPPVVSDAFERLLQMLPQQTARRLGQSPPGHKLGLVNVTLAARR